MAQPTLLPDWATGTNYSAGIYIGNANKSTPPSATVAEGFNGGYGLPAEWLNSILNTHGAWLRYSAFGAAKRIRETWVQIPGGTWTNTTQRLSSGLTSTAGSASSAVAPTATYNSPSVQVSVAGATNVTQFTTDKTIFACSATGLAAFFDVDVAMSAIGGNACDIFVGFADPNAGGPNTSPSRAMVFRKLSTDTNWQYLTGNGAAQVANGTGIPPVAATFQNLRIEISQVSGPTNVAAFYLNGVLIAATSTDVDISSASLAPYLYVKSTAGTGNTVSFGNFAFGWSP